MLPSHACPWGGHTAGQQKTTLNLRQQVLPAAGAATQGHKAALGLVLGAQLAASTPPPPPAYRAAAMAGQQLPQALTPHGLGLILPTQHRLKPAPAAAPPTHQAAGSAQGPSKPQLPRQVGPGTMGPSSWWAHLLWLVLPKHDVANTCPCNTRVQPLAMPCLIPPGVPVRSSAE